LYTLSIAEWNRAAGQTAGSPSGAGSRCCWGKTATYRSVSLSMPTTHRPERPVLLAVDQQLGEGATLGVAPELADPLGAVSSYHPQRVSR
jgi:hypothetical protein